MIDINHLKFRYGTHEVFRDFSLKLNTGNVIGLLGKNGSGKSTLLKILSGLIFPNSGDVRVGGFVPARRQPDFLKDIYIIPEEFHLPDVNINTLLKTYATFYPHFDKAEFDEHIKVLEVPRDKGFGSMSLGQKKKAIISFGLACNTSVLLMDEPTNGLDIMSKSHFKTIMQSVRRDHRNIIISTHQAHDLETIINHLIVLDERGVLLNTSLLSLCDAFVYKMHAAALPAQSPVYVERNADETYNFVLQNTDALPNKDYNIPVELVYKSLVSQPQLFQSLNPTV